MLRNGAFVCSELGASTNDHCLFLRSSELLLSISPRAQNSQTQNQGASSLPSPIQAFLQQHQHAPSLQPISPEYRNEQRELEEREADLYLSARSAFESREFLRVMRKLTPCTSAKSIFLRTYAEFIVRTCCFILSADISLILPL